MATAARPAVTVLRLGRTDMLLRSPAIDLALPLAFVALMFVAGLGFARAGMPDVVGLCVVGLVGGVAWVRAVCSVPPHGTGGEDGWPR